MSITDELRKYVADNRAIYMTPFAAKCLIGIADSIDAEHERAVASVMNDALYHANEKDMAEFGWIRLPKDADGEYIRVGERVQLIGNDPSTVSHMSLADDGWRVYVKYDGGIRTGSGEPKRIRHHYAPTVEDVLREFAEGLGVPVADSYVAAAAAKLRLAEGEDA